MIAMVRNYSLTARNAEIVDKERRGSTIILRIKATGITRRHARRNAKVKAREFIGILDQEVINTTVLKKRSLSNDYLITITN